MARAVDGRVCCAAARAGDVLGGARDQDSLLVGARALDEAGPEHLSFLARPDYREAARASRAGCVIVANEADLPGRTVIVVADPHRALALALGLFEPAVTRAPGLGAGAVVHPSAVLHESVHVGARAVIEAGCTVGAGTAILAGVVMGEGCALGADCILHPGVVLYPGTQLGDRVIVHANAVLGSDGFGYSSGPAGHLKVPHLGRVVLEDDVEIGAGTCVDRAVMGETRIGAGTKIDNLVQVGHNVTIGRDSLLVAQSGVAGSSRLGQGCVLAGQAGVGGHLELGDGARVAAKSAALASVPAGATVSGIPAIPHAEWLRVAAAQRRLPEALRQLRRAGQVGRGRPDAAAAAADAAQNSADDQGGADDAGSDQAGG